MTDKENHHHACIDEIIASITQSAKGIEKLWSKNKLSCDLYDNKKRLFKIVDELADIQDEIELKLEEDKQKKEKQTKRNKFVETMLEDLFS